MPYAAYHDDALPLAKPTERALDELAAGEPPAGLLLLDMPFASFAPLARFPRLEVLKVRGAKALASLTGLEALPALRLLVVAPAAERDVLAVDSFAPLRALANLERLHLLAMSVRDGDYAPIEAMTRLRELELTGADLDLARCARLAARLPHTAGRCLRPFTEIEGVGRCKRCRGRTVLLTGAPRRARSWLCPVCNATRLSEHVARFEAAKRAAASG